MECIDTIHHEIECTEPFINNGPYTKNITKITRLYGKDRIRLDLSKPIPNIDLDRVVEVVNCSDLKQLELFKNVIDLTFSDSFDQQIYRGDIPKSVKCITFGDAFNRPIIPQSLYRCSIKRIKFGYSFNQELVKNSIPGLTTHLIFGACFDKKINIGVLPKSLKYLSFGYYFNQPILPGEIPNSVVELVFGSYNYCKNMTTIDYKSYGSWFDQKIVYGSIPCSVRLLVFGMWFYSRTLGLRAWVIPNSVEHIVFVNCYNLDLDHIYIPRSVDQISFVNYSGLELSEGMIHDRVTRINFGSSYPTLINIDKQTRLETNMFKRDAIPKSVKHIYIDNKMFTRGTAEFDNLFYDYMPSYYNKKIRIDVDELFANR